MLPDNFLLNIHEKCERLFTLKMKHLNKSLFADGKPTLIDLYQNPDALHLPHLPADLQLDYFFTNFDDVVIQSGRRAQKSPEQEMTVTRAIWFYGLDEQHSISSYHRGTRFNIVAMAFVLGIQLAIADHHLLQGLSEDALAFASTFFHAWWSSLTSANPSGRIRCLEEFLVEWKKGKLDLMFFTKVQAQKMQQALRALDTFPFPHDLAIQAEEFIQNSVILTSAQLKQYGPALAYHWYLKQEELAREEARARAAKKAEKEMDLEGLGLSEETLLITLRAVNWGHPLIKALMVEVDVSEWPEPVSRVSDSDRWWMGTTRAIELMKDDMGEVADLLKGMNL